ncbi:MAG: hypothetical protein DHS80DRAFT_14825 [Piptocephalis tieghemiana]|nr:MAG: hypothetical protein DHS80DRAFT_14825 [Piptocephalis tieghemiana]
MDKALEDPLSPPSSSSSSSSSSSTLLSLYGHVSATARTYRSSIAYFLRAFTLHPSDPILNLSLGISYLGRAMQRTTADRQSEILWGFSYLYRYADLRSGTPSSPWDQEVHYNLARAFHHLGLVHLAIPHYEKVLEMDDPTNLCFEAAYNLSLIYLTSGSPLLASSLLDKYCTV